MLIGSLVAALVLGFLAGGRIDNLASVRLRLVQALFLGLILRYATQFAIENGNAVADGLRLPLFTFGFLMLLTGLWVNREHPGLPLAFVGILLNAVAMIINGGFMPVWQPSIVAAGLPADTLGTGFHTILYPTPGIAIPPDFLLRAGPLGDIIPIPVPGLRNVASIGDIFLAAGLAFFLFATLVRLPAELEAAGSATILRRVTVFGRRRPVSGAGALSGEAAAVAIAPPLGTGPGVTIDVPYDEPWLDGAIDVSPDVGLGSRTLTDRLDGLSAAATVERRLVLGGGSIGTGAGRGAGPLGAGGRLGTAGAIGGAGSYADVPAVPAIPPLIARVRRHPYVRLALDSSFSALWMGQLISLLGDRVHQVALAFVVLRATGSPIAVGTVFFMATLPNLLFGPIAGTLVDRWDHREVMIVSDLVRAGLVLLIPIAAVTNLLLVYPLVFLVTTVSIFFRPAKGAILPRIVPADDLIPANSALWIGETFADIGGYVLAGLFVALLGSQLPLAFWVDAVTYLGSAILIASIAVAPLAHRPSTADEAEAEAAADAAGASSSRLRRLGLGRFGAELREGWQFLRSDAVLLANTLQATVGQFMLGIFLALTPIYAASSIDRMGYDDTTAYSFLEGAIGAGNLIGGFVIGLIGSRLALGRTVILGYVVTGATVAGLALTGNFVVAIGLCFGAGVGNLAFVIPSQTLIQRRTPPELMGRVLGLRFSIVVGAMTFAMAIGGVLATVFGAGSVIGIFGLLTVVAGLGGLFVPAVRDA